MRLWLGANDENKERSFRWIADNSSVEFTDWWPGEPNNKNVENWVEKKSKAKQTRVVNTYQWNDRRCSKSQKFICEK